MIEKISKPYRLFSTPAMIAAGEYTERSFANLKEAREYIKRMQKIDPTFHPEPLRAALFKYYDNATGKLYTSTAEYYAEQERARNWRAQQIDESEPVAYSQA